VSQAYAQRIRNVAIATTAATAVFLGVALFWLSRLPTDTDDFRRAEFVRFRPYGGRLPLVQLSAHERVVVTLVCHRNRENLAWTYVLDGAAPQLLTRMTRALSQEPGYGLRPADITASDAYELTTDDLVGLELALRLLRTVPADPKTRYYDTYAIEYFRGGKLIGEERFVDDTLYRHGDLGYEQLPVAATRALSVVDWELLVTFSEIAHRITPEATAN
jgi:hypothetical protein